VNVSGELVGWDVRMETPLIWLIVELEGWFNGWLYGGWSFEGCRMVSEMAIGSESELASLSDAR
jgi:hypothetical protein